MTTTKEHDERIRTMSFAAIYPLYLNRLEKNGHTEKELRKIIKWLTGYNARDVQRLIKKDATFEQFFAGATLNPNAQLIKGVVCGYRIEDIKTPLTRQCRYLEKMLDELCRGRKMEKILRTPKDD